jgi:1-deoxy-D-xylulose-5-phosphate reductoisomerase
MPEIIEKCMNVSSFIKTPTLEDYLQSDKEVRILAESLINNKN